jgi:hypothetical protein
MSVPDQKPFVEALARQLITHCRSEIAAALVQIEAARAILESTQWLLERWEASRQSEAAGIRLPDYDGARASGFVSVEDEGPRRRRRRRRARQ